MDLKDKVLQRINYKEFYTKHLGELGAPNKHHECQVVCPFHSDNDPSLSVNIKTGLFKCFGCKESGDVFHFYQKTSGFDFKTALERMADDLGIKKNGKGLGSILNTYTYQDIEGNTVFEVVRFENKEIRLRRPDGNGGWIWNIRGLSPLPYNLQGIESAKTVFICEGEKDANTLIDLGLTATTNSNGAGNWKRELNPFFQGKDVVLLPDNDEPGREHAETVAHELAGIASSIKIVELPGLAHKGDVTDFINGLEGSDKRKRMRLMLIVQNTAVWEPSADTLEDEEDEEDEPTELYEPFPEDIMSGLGGDFAEAQAECVEAPKHFIYMSFITALGSLISGRATINRSLNIQPRLYTLILGETAEGRKSTAMGIVTAFFENALGEAEDGHLNVSWGFGSGEGLQKRLEEDNHLLLCLDEFKSFVSKATIRNSVLLPCVTQLFERNNYENQTKTTKVSIQDAHFSMLAASTIDTYESTWDASFSDIGFLNRLFLVVGSSERKFAFPMALDHADEVRFKARLRQMVKLVHGNGGLVLAFEEDAKERHRAWYHEREASIYSRRLNVYALRLMILLAINDNKRMIDLETVEKAITLCDWQLSIRKALSPVDADNAMAAMEEKIRRLLSSKGAMTKRELRQYVHAERSGLWTFNTALNNLMEAEDVYKKEQGRTTVFEFSKD